MAAVLRDAPPVAFLSTSEPAHAKAFYEDVLGLPLVSEDGFALVFDLNGTTLRLTRVDQLTAQPFTVLGWNVDDIDEAVRDLAARGVVFERYAALDQDSAGVWRSPSGARVAWFKDPDGNLLSISQH
jgi:catechol 2,3-dioxygenase-like lactoylglutathione lyase family enzyme